MQMEISKEMDKELKETAKLLGIKREDVMKKALKHYTEEVKKIIELKNEIKTWDKLSDESFENFERELWKMEKSG